MQPYFIPYAGYFRLMEAADLFVIYDCVQFARRGYLHRNQLLKPNGKKDWINLPLVKQPQSTKINQLIFKPDADKILMKRLQAFGFKPNSLDSQLEDHLYNTNLPVTRYLKELLEYFCVKLEINTKFVYSSDLAIDSQYKGQQRILAIAKQLKAQSYINAPNGIKLYQDHAFKKQGIALRFLDTYKGEEISILQHFLGHNKEVKTLIHSIKDQSKTFSQKELVIC